MSNRIEKVNSLLEHEIGQIILRNFSFQGTLVTLTHVETTPNLIEAKAYISVIPDKDSERIVGILNKGVYSIQQVINKKLNMRPIPRINFVKDDNVKEAARVEELLNKLKNTQK